MRWAVLALAPTLGACLAVTPAAPKATAVSNVTAVPRATAAPNATAAPTAPAVQKPGAGQQPTAAQDVAQPTPTVPSVLVPPAPPAALAPPPFLVGASYEPRAASTSKVLEAPTFDFETRSIEFGPQTPTLPCVIGGRPSRCVELADGPWLVTDYETLEGCPDSLYLASSPGPDGEASAATVTLSWTVRVSEHGIHGAKIAVPRGARLFAALEPRRSNPSNSPRCRITWSGQRPHEPRAPQPALMESPYR